MIVRAYNPVEGGPAIWIEHLIDDVSCARFLRQLREHPEGDGPIELVMAGGGGDCGRGLEMYTALRELPRPKRVTVYSAPSMSGVIAMAGDHIRIVEGGTFMLHHAGFNGERLLNGGLSRFHNPASALRRLARSCDVTDALHCQIFARRTGQPASVIADIRERETTIAADEAVRLGLADEVIPWC